MLAAHCARGGAHITLLFVMHGLGLLHCMLLPLLSVAYVQVNNFMMLCGSGRAHTAMRGA